MDDTNDKKLTWSLQSHNHHTWMKPDAYLQVLFIQITISTIPYIECDNGDARTLNSEGITTHADWVE